MKKTIVVLGLILLCASTLMAGGTAEGADAEAGSDKPIQIVMAGGSVGGSGLPAAVAWAEKAKASYPDSVIDVIPGGTLQNILRLKVEDIDIGLVTISTLTKAYKGMTPPKEFETPLENLRGINIFWNQFYHFIVPEKFQAETVDEIFEKKMPIRICPGGPRGHMGVLATEEMLKTTWNVSFDDIISWGGQVIYTEFGDAVQMLKDGQLDVFSPLTAAPNSTIMELSTLSNVKFLPMGKKSVAAMVENGYPEIMIPAGVYKGIDEDLLSIAAPYGAAAHVNVSEDVVYKLTKVLCENDEYMRNVNATLKNFQPENFKSFLIPLHPGAERYYREQGWIE